MAGRRSKRPAGLIRHRGEHAAGDDFAFDASEPDFDLIEPGRVGGSEVKLHVGMIGKEILHELRFMGRQVVQNDVDFLLGWATGDDLAQEGDEFCAGVTGRGPSVNLSRLGVEGGVKRQCAVPVIFKAVALGASRAKRQHRGRGDPGPEWRSFHRRKTRPRAVGD
jgi:hypothetical protein